MTTPMNDDEAELARLLAEAAPDPLEREALAESHRQLEKDLLRLADPLPPADFVAAVMAKVEAEPQRVSAGEVRSAVLIAVVGLAASAMAFLRSGASADGVALEFAQGLVAAREVLVGFGSGLAAVWRTAGLPLSVTLAVVVMVTLVGLRRLVAPENSKVVA
ncbi:MAG: hypothetical protein MUC96_10755 [Myxococcaceae bacterium]|jgi:hypothetical protein|nr:hypothetical protein [Myxococcaceae bacterium]